MCEALKRTLSHAFRSNASFRAGASKALLLNQTLGMC